MARDALATILGYLLREECALSDTTRDYRWKISGPNRYSLHRLFDEQRRQLDYWLDKVIDRTKSAGLAACIPWVDARRSVENTGPVRRALPPGTIIGDLLARHEQMAERLRESIGHLADPGLVELLTRLVEFHETAAWMLRVVYGGAGSDPAV